MGLKNTHKILAALLAVTLAAVMALSCAGAENAQISRQRLSALYNWLYRIDPGSWNTVTYDRISEAAGKPGAVMGGVDSCSAYWTDGNAYVTVTFRNANGKWLMSGLAMTGLSREEYIGAELPETTEAPTAIPTETPEPTPEPTEAPTATQEPTSEPGEAPITTLRPTSEPIKAPAETQEPTPEPTEASTATPAPTPEPTAEPAKTPAPEPFDLDFIRNSAYMKNGKIRIAENKDGTGNTYVYNEFSAEELSFSHEYESDHYYSYADFDIVVVNAGKSDGRPILRMWIALYGKAFSPDVSSVSFITGGKEYIFSGLQDNGGITKEGEDYKQTILIRFDKIGLQFLNDLAYAYLTGESSVKAVFHGREEIETELGEHFWDIYAMYWDLYVNSGAMNYLDGYEATPAAIQPAE